MEIREIFFIHLIKNLDGYIKFSITMMNLVNQLYGKE